MKGGFLFKIIEEQFDNWKSDYRCPPDGSDIDCGAMVLSFLGVPYDISVELQTTSNKQGGLTPKQLILALNKLDKTDFESFTRLEDVYTKQFSNGKKLFQFVQNEIPPEYAAIVIGEGSKTIGHFFIIFKDSDDEIFILDPQASLFFSMTTATTIDEYLSTFDNGFYILLGKTCELSKFNNLYKTYKSKNGKSSRFRKYIDTSEKMDIRETNEEKEFSEEEYGDEEASGYTPFEATMRRSKLADMSRRARELNDSMQGIFGKNAFEMDGGKKNSKTRNSKTKNSKTKNSKTKKSKTKKSKTKKSKTKKSKTKKSKTRKSKTRKSKTKK